MNPEGLPLLPLLYKFLGEMSLNSLVFFIEIVDHLLVPLDGRSQMVCLFPELLHLFLDNFLFSLRQLDSLPQIDLLFSQVFKGVVFV